MRGWRESSEGYVEDDIIRANEHAQRVDGYEADLAGGVDCECVGRAAGDGHCRSGRWEQPASALAEQIAGILGPGQAQLSIRNLSTIAAGEVPSIRRLLEQDLKGHGVLISGAESANTIRITLSESERDRVWVAEIVQGNETRVAMVEAPLEAARVTAAEQRILLRKEKYLGATEFSQPGEPVLAALETSGGLVVLEREEISFFAQTAGGWKQQKSFPIGQRLPLARDAHGILRGTAGGGFSASAPGTECTGSYSPSTESGGRMGEWAVRCGSSDDPWTIEQTAGAGGSGASAVVTEGFLQCGSQLFHGGCYSEYGSGSAAVLFCGVGSASRRWGGAFADGN